ncbi:hypothetical protein D4765_18420 [Subtercola vilae]|uniref:Uncharacterized protein n=1 Tax=Subtercola vilae TaxID=2056433 RepID=A0A4T2BBP0_9MICO|nr:hypothetical protein D4765_18420 [Subtercola vilae]
MRDTRVPELAELTRETAEFIWAQRSALQELQDNNSARVSADARSSMHAAMHVMAKGAIEILETLLEATCDSIDLSESVGEAWIMAFLVSDALNRDLSVADHEAS